MALRDHIEELMKDYGNLTVSDLARLTNIPQPTLHHLLTGNTQRPRKKLLKALADFFGISTEELIGQRKNHSVPMLSWHELKNLKDLNLQDKNRKKVLTELDLDDSAFALQCASDDMEPLFPRGCILIFDPVRIPIDRNFVLVYIEKQQEYYLNRIFIDNRSQYVKTNLGLDLHKLSENDCILATLVESKVQF